MLVSPELADVLGAIISRIRDPSGKVPLVAGYDRHERRWRPPAPFLFQRSVYGENRALTEESVRTILNAALAATGLTDPQTGGPLQYTPHDFRRMFITDAKMGRIAFDASFGRSREHALPAAQRAALRCRGPGGSLCACGDLGIRGLPVADATMMRLVLPVPVHHRCGCWHGDAARCGWLR